MHYVPHNEQTASNFPVVGSSHSPVIGSPQQPSTYKDSDSNVQEDFTNPSNNENGDVNESKYSTWLSGLKQWWIIICQKFWT